MKVKHLISILFLIISIPTIQAQVSYEKMKTDAITALKNGDFFKAKFCIDIARVRENANKQEIENLNKMLRDSIDATYDRAEKLYIESKYALAANEYHKLMSRDSKPRKLVEKPIYARVGYCFEKMKENERAYYYYKIGVDENESLSALYLALYTRRNLGDSTPQDRIQLYEKASVYVAALDSLGVEYKRIGDEKKSYDNFKKSQSSFGKYNRASYLLDEQIVARLSDDQKNDDPIQLLKEASDLNYSPAQYYLGMLYYFADNNANAVKKNTEEGEKMLAKASEQGHNNARKILNRISYGYTMPSSIYAKNSSLSALESKANNMSRPYDSYKPKSSFIDVFTPEDQTWGLGYSYSEYFPLTLTANYTYSCLSVGAEMGYDFNEKEYKENKYNPIGYFAVSPGFYCRFLSINCGVGVLFNSYMKTRSWNDSYTDEFGGGNDDGSITVGGSTSITTSGSISTSAYKCYFMLKPSITGYIPIGGEDYYITINAGYNYLPKFKELNGWSFGIGFQWVIW